jgi:hypothetical protein
MAIEKSLPLLESIFAEWKGPLGDDYLGYRNHVYRMIHFCLALRECSAEEKRRIVIAGCFHDLGIWAEDTIDYLPPSIALAQHYLRREKLDSWVPEIELMIDMHHKLRKYSDVRYPLVEVFRRGDLVDFSLGAVTWGLPRSYIDEVKAQFPNAGFHKRLTELAMGWFAKHPLRPPPFFKW